MRKLQGIAVTVIGLIVMLLLFEAFVPEAKGVTVGFLGVGWAYVKGFFLKDWVLSVGCFILGSIALCGTVFLSRRKETKMWGIATGIVSFLSYAALFVKCSGSN